MKNILKNTMVRILMLSTMSICLSSCFVSRVSVTSNGFQTADKMAKNKADITYSQVKNVYLFWGLLPISSQQPPLPADCNYIVQTSTNFFDGLLFGLTDGIFGMRTVKILVKPTGLIPAKDIK